MTEFPSKIPGAFPASALLMAAGLGFLGGIVGASVVQRTGRNVLPFPSGTASQGPLAARVSGPTDDPIADVVERVSPAVVNVIVTKDLPKLEDVLLDPFGNPFFGPSPFRFRVRRPSGETEPQEIGGGTGFIVSADGLILTNRHVVADVEADYTVVLNTGEKVPARVLARDSALDLAVLRVEKRGLPTIAFGNSDTLRVGQSVIAIGNALGEFRNTVSVGVVSGLGRQITAGNQVTGQAEVLDHIIQTDAAINPGNSGGPLLNLRGEAIGINTAIAGGAENIGFALPASEASRVLADVQAHGRIVRPFLGVRYVIITPAVAKANTLPVDYGALVLGGEGAERAVVPGSPADRAGIKEDDILLEFDGKRIDEQNSLASLIRQKKVGDRVRVKVRSGGQEKTVDIVLTEAQ
ncbi:MAG: trypsin-like peptidase domain-containing protein [bacterium]|nr:trypsin-like peptidase domain-containing protein [bacterium]